MRLFPVHFRNLLSPSLTESAVTAFFFLSGCPSLKFEVVMKKIRLEEKQSPITKTTWKGKKSQGEFRFLKILCFWPEEITHFASWLRGLQTGPRDRADIGASSWIAWPDLYPLESPTIIL